VFTVPVMNSLLTKATLTSNYYQQSSRLKAQVRAPGTTNHYNHYKNTDLSTAKTR